MARSGVLKRALVAAVAGDVDTLRALNQGHDLSGLAALAGAHGVAGLAHRAFQDVPDADRDLVRALEDLHHLALGTHLRALGDLTSAADSLDGSGVPWMVVKGPALAEVVYEAPGLRGYGDLDLVVPRASFARAIEALGGEVLDRNWRLIAREGRGQLHVRLPFGTVADVHWHLVNHSREPFRIPMAELFDRARTVDLNGTCVRTLDPHDTLLHVGLHACLSGAWKLVWLADIDRAFAAADPEVVAERAAGWGVGAPMATILHRARTVLGTPVPDELLRVLVPRASRRALVAACDRLASRTGTAPVAGVLARTSGRGPVRGAALVTRGMRMRMANRLQRRRHGHRLLAPVGDERDAAAYLATLSSGEAAVKAS